MVETIREFLRWLPVAVIPIFNGIVRMTTYGKGLSEFTSSLISSMFDILFIGFYATLLQRWQGAGQLRPSLRGALWLTLSTLIHFLLGHFVFGLTYEQLLKKYDLWEGQLWGLISVAIALCPWLAASGHSAINDRV